MANITMSILGLYNYDNTIFEHLSVPGNVDRDGILIPNLLAELAEMEVLYPDPAIMKTLIQVWSLKQMPVWIKLQATVNLQYNPIYNKDGYYEETETRDLANSKTGNNSNTKNGHNTTTKQITKGNTLDYDSTISDSGENTNRVSAFNSTTFENREKDEISNTRTDEYSSHGSENIGETDSDIIAETIADVISESGTETGDITRERHEYGNIGVTTTQQMIKEEREVSQFNIYNYIIEDFKQRFCVLVY